MTEDELKNDVSYVTHNAVVSHLFFRRFPEQKILFER